MKPASTTVTPQQNVAREAVIVQNMEIVNNLARRMHRRIPPCVTFDDLTSAGTLGLIEAVDRFDQSRGLKFKSYAQHRIWGAMLDFLRKEDPLSRDERRRIRHSVSADGPMTISLNQLLPEIANRLTAISDRTPFELVVGREVRSARGCLSARENHVIRLLYDLDWQSRQVAAELNVNESRVSQIKHRAIAKLRAAFAQDVRAA